MTSDELIWRIAGGSGDGIDSTSKAFAKALMRSGLNVFTHRHFPSRIRGGHTYVEIRAAGHEVNSRGDGYNCLLALGDSFGRNPDEDAIYGNEEIAPLEENLDDLDDGGVIVYDAGVIDTDLIDNFDERVEDNNWHVYDIDLRELAREHGRDIMRNTAGVGVTAELIDFPLENVEELIEENMGGDIAEQNLAVLRDGAEQAAEFDQNHDLTVPTGEHDEEQVLMSGSYAIAYGALDAGCRYIAGYPMTPWTEVFTIMSNYLPDMGGIADQVEDEIAAAGAAIGASHAGVKAMTGSSGGGFALMSEYLGTAEMTETPLVVVEAMRAGPSTGLPTKPEQSDLECVLYSSQGDSCRVVFAPGNHRESYRQTRLAFELAYEYQVPALVIYDQKMQGENRSLPRSVFDEAPNPDLGKTLTEDELEDAAHDVSGKFERFALESDDGAVPRSLPGQKGGRFLATGNEHLPSGHITEVPEIRTAQMSRRMSKLESVREDLQELPDSNQTYYGPDEADYGIITWGSMQGAVADAVDELTDEGYSVRGISVSDMMPYPREEMEEFLSSVDEALIVEMNASAQFRNLTKRELGKYGDKLSSLLKYDGDPVEPAEIKEAVDIELIGDAAAPTSTNTEIKPAAGD